jgi:predicted DNA-binding transcriptional regulator AlpA
MPDSAVSFPTGDELIRPTAMRREMGGIAISTLYDWIATGLVPPPVRMSPRVVGWPRSVVERIKAERAAGNLPRVDREAIRRQRREARAAQAEAAR